MSRFQRCILTVFKEVGWHEAIDEDGFAIRPGLFSHESLDRLLPEIYELAPQRSRAGVRHARRLAPIAEFARRSEMINFARQFLEPDAFPFRYAHAPTNALNQVSEPSI